MSDAIVAKLRKNEFQLKMKIYRKDYDPKINYRKIHLSGEIRRLNN